MPVSGKTEKIKTRWYPWGVTKDSEEISKKKTCIL